MTGNNLGLNATHDDVVPLDSRVVQKVINELSAAGIQARGEMVSATEHEIADVILQRARALDVDLLILDNEYHSNAGQGLRISVAEQVIRQHPTLSILLARPPE